MVDASVRVAAMRFAVGVCVAVLYLGCAAQDSDPSRPNILLISIDSLRADHLGSYGYPKPTSPTLDRLAAEGVRFETAVSTTSWTLPSHAALFTGLFDTAHGLVDNGLRLDDAHKTLAERLRDHGYRTAGFYGGPYLHPTFGLGQGFDHYQSCMTAIPDGMNGEEVRRHADAGVAVSHRDITGPRTLAEVESWLDRADGGPLFLFVHLWDVHYDYIPPREIAAQFVDSDYRGSVDGRDFARIVRERRRLTPEERRHVIGLYDAEIRATDDTVRGLLEALAERQLAEDTLVVVTADHGEEFFERGGWGHQSTLFEEQVRVPLIFHWPKKLAPRVVPDLARLVDVMATLLAQAGAPQAPGSQGRDLGPLLRGERLSEESALLELLVSGSRLRALRDHDWKFVDAGPGRAAGGYDLAGDPGERVFRRDAEPVRAGLARLHEAVERASALRAQTKRGAHAVEVSDDVRRALRELGYTEE